MPHPPVYCQLEYIFYHVSVSQHDIRTYVHTYIRSGDYNGQSSDTRHLRIN